MESIEFIMTPTEQSEQCIQSLAKRGIHVTVCERSGEAALKAILEKRPKAVLLEAFLPELDAIAIKQRCEAAGLTGILFFAMGGFQSSAMEQQLMDAGFSFYFVKPFHPEVLVQRLVGMLAAAAKPVKAVSEEMQVTEILHQICFLTANRDLCPCRLQNVKFLPFYTFVLTKKPASILVDAG